MTEAWRGIERHGDSFAGIEGHSTHQGAPEVISLGQLIKNQTLMVRVLERFVQFSYRGKYFTTVVNARDFLLHLYLDTLCIHSLIYLDTLCLLVQYIWTLCAYWFSISGHPVPTGLEYLDTLCLVVQNIWTPCAYWFRISGHPVPIGLEYLDILCLVVQYIWTPCAYWFRLS